MWQAIRPLLPAPPLGYRGRPRIDDRACLAGFVYQLRNGGALAAAAGPRAGLRQLVTCWRRLRNWQRAGVGRQLHHLLLDELGHQGQLDWSRASLDSVSVSAKRGATRPVRAQQTAASPAPRTTCWSTGAASR